MKVVCDERGEALYWRGYSGGFGAGARSVGIAEVEVGCGIILNHGKGILDAEVRVRDGWRGFVYW